MSKLKLESRRDEALAELRTLADNDMPEGSAEQERFDELTAEVETLNRRLDVFAAAERRGSSEVGEDRSVQYMKRTNQDVDIRSASSLEVRDAALAMLEAEHRAQTVTITDDTAADLADQFVRRAVADDGTVIFDGGALARRFLATETPAYRSAFQKAMWSATPAWDSDEANAMAYARIAEMSLTNASGGYGVPVTLDPTIILTSGADVAPLLSVARVERITSNIWKGVSSAGVAFASHSEGAEVSAQQATLAQPTITPETTAAFIPFSVEIQGDYPSFANEMAGLIEAAYIDFLAKETATGAAGVIGIFTAIDATSASEVTPTTDGLLGPEDALKVWNALPERFRARASWFMNVTVESKLRVGSDGYGSRDLSSEGIGPLLGKRVLLSDHAPAFSGTTGAANLAILGDFRHYVVAQRVGMSIELIPHLFGVTANLPTLQRGYVAWARVGADSVADEAFRLLQNQ